ncbi:chaperone protein DnaK [Cladorrhinum sp. PSN332]|nr:chaperone protein DnaK [Cladorrhinum sp. PSN332]
MSSSQHEIIVSIDFGTTFSGIAWGEILNFEGQKIRAIERWPSSTYNPVGKECKKVPTRIWYGDRDGMHWGFQIPSNAPRNEIAEWFKLDLDPYLQSMADAVRRAEKTKTALGVNKLATDYISALHEHLKYTLKEQGLNGDEAIPVQFVVAVPAVWTDLAKSKTIAACQLALGLTAPEPPIRVVSEPEAAAVYALYNCKNHGLNIGDSFVICNAGGGTVDLISYTITKLNPILEVEEAATGTGALCGSLTVNWRFEEYLKRKFGHLPGFDEFLSTAMENFEDKIKPEFTLEDHERVYPLPGLAFLDRMQKEKREEIFLLKTKHLQEVFEPAVSEVVELVKKQIAHTKVPIRAVFLVGGFGSSNYLTERLRNVVDGNIQVLRPHEAWLSVAFGAVMMGQALNASQAALVHVAHRRARRHYGIEITTPYQEERHSHIQNKKYRHPAVGDWRVLVMDWFITKGDRVSENKPFLHEYIQYEQVPLDRSGCHNFSTKICMNEKSEEAPLLRDDNTNVLCNLLAGLSSIPEPLLPRMRGFDGNLYYAVPFKIEVVFLSATTEYTLIYEGKRHGKVTAEYA